MVLGLASVAMLFIALTSAFVVRMGQTFDGRPLPMPPVLWVTTALLLGTSLTLEKARRSGFLRRGHDDGAAARRARKALNLWLSITLVLGTMFIAGQFAAWRSLAAQGVYANSNPQSSFFYVMTGMHALHLVGGIAALAYLTARASLASEFSPDWTAYSARRRRWFEAVALYWHFMDGLWLYLLSLLFAWK
jgi:cytochrome c oxidase subunit 3